MNFKQIIITTASEYCDIISNLFFELGALSVTTEDAHAGTDLERPIFDEPGEATDNMWSDSIVTVLTTYDTSTSAWIKQIESIIHKKLNYTVDILEDEDWVRKTQSQFNPIKVADNLYIVPSWHESPNPHAVVINLDPGLAFGTGSHPTTFMCLEWLSANTCDATNLLDYGCGSGILAITAKKLGVKEVYGTDIDPLALEASNSNAAQNSIIVLTNSIVKQNSMTLTSNEAANNNVTQNGTVSFCLPEQLPKQEFDIVVANILSNPLRILAPALATLTKNKLILSGILAEQADELITIYSQWFSVKIAKIMDGWALLECNKK